MKPLLGVERPGITSAWPPAVREERPAFTLHYRHGERFYTLVVKPADGAAPRVVMDGADCPGGRIPLVNDGRDHRVEVTV